MVRRPFYIERPIDGTQNNIHPAAEGPSYPNRIANGVPGLKTSAGKPLYLLTVYTQRPNPTPAPPTHHLIPSPLTSDLAFLTSLSANLLLPDAYDPNAPSPVSTPPSMRASTELSSSITQLPPPSPLAFAFAASAAADTLDPPSIPLAAPLITPTPAPALDVTYTTAPTDAEKAAALALVADSVKQQRHLAFRAVVLHPGVLGVYAAVLVLIAQLLFRSCGGIAFVGTTWIGLTVAALAGVGWLTRGYARLSEEIDRGWLGGDQVIVAKEDGEVVGALVLGWVCEGRGSGRRRNKWRGVVRAWTVEVSCRLQGVGTGLLEAVVTAVGNKGGEGVEFAEGHACALIPVYL